MKKQFFRVKQLADQTFSRGNKNTDDKHDELHRADCKVENLRGAVQAMYKRLCPSGAPGPMQVLDSALRDKKLKKLPEYQLGQTMQDSCGTEDNKLLRFIMLECGKMEIKLANEAADHEVRVETLVGKELNNLTETEFPNVVKAKKQLTKLLNEKDAAVSRYQSLQRQSEPNNVKIAQAREEVEEAEQKAEQSRDAFASDMFSLIVKEADVANFILQYVHLQTAYHKSVLDTLSDVVKELQNQIEENSHKRVFGAPLEEHLRVTGQTVALPVQLCVCALLNLGLSEEGLFRMAGSSSRLKRLKLSLDSGIFETPLCPEYRDVHVLAGVLKSYLRELPEPLLTRHLYEPFLNAITDNNSEEARLKDLKKVIKELPKANYDNLRYLIKFFSVLSQHQTVNKMTPSNISIVVAPNILWSDSSMVDNMTKASTVNCVVELLVKHADLLFEGEINFYTTYTRENLLPDLYEYGFAPTDGRGICNQGFNPVSDHPNGEQNMSKSLNEYSSSSAALSYMAPRNNVNLVQNSQTHSRSNSHDTSLILVDGDIKRTQSNSSLSDPPSSPPQGSPKPFTRKKNKPIAPVPPNFTPPDKSHQNASRLNNSTNVKVDLSQTKVSYNNKNEPDKPEKPPRPAPVALPESSKIVSGVQTINRSTYKNNKLGGRMGQRLMSSRENLTDLSIKERRKSFEFEHENVGKEAKPLEDHPSVSTVESITVHHGIVGKLTVSEGCQTSSISKNPVNIRSGVIPSKQVLPSDHPVAPANKPTPVPAPRTSFVTPLPPVKHDAATFTEIESVYDVQLRPRPSLESIPALPGKPAVPERPLTLRPQSFRNSNQKNQSLEMLASLDAPHNGNGGNGALLERTHMYNVEKHHPAIIQVGNSQDKPVSPTGRVSDSGIPSPDEDKPNIQRTHSTGSSTPSVTKPELPKSEHKTLTSQMRKLSQSEGNILDVPPSPRAYHKLPRPQEPAPPPPTKAPVQDSTDL